MGQRVLAGQPEATVERTANLVVTENRKPGATDWQLTRVRADRDGFRSPWIEGYCSKQSVKAGETIDIMVSTQPPRRFRIEIFRMGYYGGRGARPVTTLGPFEGKAQTVPTPGTKNLHECRWEPAVRFTIPGDWPSGVYLGRLTTVVDGDTEPYWQSYVVFIVRDDRPADILFQCSDNTWQAYNRWPNNYSLYTHPRGNQGPWADVSFDRPYGREAQHDGVVNDPLTFGSGEFLPFEFPLAYWLEQHGYDVTYCSNSDMLTPDRGLRCKAFLSVGHDEYWDIRQFRSVERMRDDGVSLLFLSGNAVCWVTPFRDSSDGRPNRIIFRGGPYGADNDYARRRQKETRPVPRARTGRGSAHGGPKRRAGQRRRRLDRRQARALDVRRHRAEERRPDPGPDRLGVPRRPAQAPRPRGRRGGHRLGRRPDPSEMDRHVLPGPQGELRLQRLDHLLGAGALVAAGSHAPLVALVAPPRAR